jgi:hypothetical protein
MVDTFHCCSIKVCTEQYLWKLFHHNGEGRRKREKPYNRMDKYNGWDRNMEEKRGGDKGMKGIKERKNWGWR